MKELVGDKFYTTLSEKYNELLLDYVLLSWDEDYHGAESHKKAVIEAILSILNTRHRVGNNIKHPLFYVHESDMRCIECDAGAFFYEDNRGRFNKGVSETPEKMKMNYWLAFSGPPYGIPYSKEDFRKINDSLFPILFRKDLEIFSWNDDFSNYFDDGKEWWGTALWSIYDKWMNRFVIIGASLTY